MTSTERHDTPGIAEVHVPPLPYPGYRRDSNPLQRLYPNGTKRGDPATKLNRAQRRKLAKQQRRAK